MKPLPITSADMVQLSQRTRELKMFASIRMEILEKILAGILLYEFDRGEKVCVQGEAGDCFCVVQRGALSVSTKKGRFSLPKPVATLGPGDCFGEMALLRRVPRSATVACDVPSRIFVLPAQHFQAVVDLNPEFAAEIRDLAATRQFELDHRYG